MGNYFFRLFSRSNETLRLSITDRDHRNEIRINFNDRGLHPKVRGASCDIANLLIYQLRGSQIEGKKLIFMFGQRRAELAEVAKILRVQGITSNWSIAFCTQSISQVLFTIRLVALSVIYAF